MRRRPISVLTCGLVGLLVLVGAATSSATTIRESEFDGFSASFRLRGTNGYRIGVHAYSERTDGKGYIAISVAKKGETATYGAPAVVTQASVHADLGVLGRIDAVRRASGREKIVPIKCSGGLKVAYEPAVYEGVIEFRGEGGYTGVRQSAAPSSVMPVFDGPCHGSGRGEELNSDRLPGARLKGTSFAHGRVLKFQVNKNRPAAKTFFSASVHERRDGVRIFRTVEGTAPPAAFTFPHSLRTATMAPPAPFSGRASLTRSRNSAVPAWRGDLALDFPGARVPIAGSGVYVTLVHARFTTSDNSSVAIGFRPALFTRSLPDPALPGAWP